VAHCKVVVDILRQVKEISPAILNDQPKIEQLLQHSCRLVILVLIKASKFIVSVEQCYQEKNSRAHRYLLL
jgi:hypothetical protein